MARMLWMLIVATVVVASGELSAAAEPPAWPCYHGPHGNFSATRVGLELVDDLAQARLLWKSEHPTPPGAAQSPRYSGQAWHRISLGDYQPLRIPIAGGGEAVSGGNGLPLPGGGARSLLVADGRVYCSFFIPSGDKIDEAERKKREAGPWIPDYWKIASDDVALAIDANTGRTLWKRVFPDQGLNWCDHKSIITGHTGCVFGGRWYVIGSTCRVHCLDATSGEIVWESDLGAEHRRLEEIKRQCLATQRAFGGINRGHCHNATFADGVFVCPDYQGGLIGFDGVTGRKLWQVSQCLAHHATPTRWVAGPTTADELILCCSASGLVRCLEPRTGKPCWTIEAGLNSPPLCVAGDLLLVNMSNDKLGTGDEMLLGRAACFRMTREGATKIWQHRGDERVGFVADGMSGVPIWDGKAFIRTKSGTSMIELATGKILARLSIAKVSQESHAYCAEGRFFHEPDSQHGAIHDVLMTGTTVETFQPLGQPWNTPHYDATGYEMPISHPVVAGKLYLRGADGVYCWDLRKQVRGNSP